MNKQSIAGSSHKTGGGKSVGLALGGGGARGLAHILMLEVFDELGVKPAYIAGTSIGAIYGAAYASGMSAREIREFTQEMFATRTGIIRRLRDRWPGSLINLWNPLTPSMFNGEIVLDIVLPDEIPLKFSSLKIPFAAVTTDFYSHEEYVVDSGELIPAITASAALPVILQPVKLHGRVLIDGGFVNPLPYDVIQEHADITVAIDVNGRPGNGGDGIPNSMETMFGVAQIVLGAILREKLKVSRPDILIAPDVGQIRVLDFFKYEKVFELTTPAKDDLKRALERVMEAEEITPA